MDEIRYSMRGAAHLLNAVASMPEDGYGQVSHEPRLVVTRNFVELSMYNYAERRVDFACKLVGTVSEDEAQRVLELAAKHCLHPADEKMWIGEEDAE